MRAASYVGVKDYIPPFLDPTLSVSELKTGVSFASAGTGLDPLTAKLSVCNSQLFFSSSKNKSAAIFSER